MKYVATEEAIVKANEYGLTELEVVQEYKARRKAYEEDDISQLVLNWKGKEIVICPVGQKTAVMFLYGHALQCSYEDLPEYVYKNNKWIRK